MPMLDHRTHKSKGSEGTASLASNASFAMRAPSINGTPTNGYDQDVAEQKPEESMDPVSVTLCELE